MKQIQTFRGCWDKEVNSSINPSTWIEEIKNGFNYKNLIEEARTDYKLFGKVRGGKYDTIKTKKLPVISWNFIFKDKKENKNAIDTTGYLYFDVDNAPGFDIKKLDKSKIFCFFKSLSETGYGIIVKTSGVTSTDFKAQYDDIAEQLGLSSYFDKNARSIDRNNVLTYDSNVFVNKDSIVLVPKEQPQQVEKSKKVQSHTNQREREGEHIGTDCTFFKYNNLDLYSNPNDVVVNPNGWDVMELYLPAEIKEGKRKATLLAYCNNLVLINPNKTQGEVFAHMMDRNAKRCIPALGSLDVADVVNSIFKYKAAGSLNERATKKRKIIFGKNCGMDKEDKKIFVNQQIGEWKKNKTKKKIYEAIESLDCKVTAKSVSEKAGVSLRTVKTYWSEFKEHVKEINLSK